MLLQLLLEDFYYRSILLDNGDIGQCSILGCWFSYHPISDFRKKLGNSPNYRGLSLSQHFTKKIICSKTVHKCDETHTSLMGGDCWLISRLEQVYKTFSDNPKWVAPLINMTFHLLKPLTNKLLTDHTWMPQQYIVTFMCALSATCLFQCYAHVVCIFSQCTHICTYKHLQSHHFLMRCCVEQGGCLFKCYRYEYSCALGGAILHPLSFFDSKIYKRLTFSVIFHF